MSETTVKDRKAVDLDEAFKHAFERYGCRVVELGEDGDSWLVDGHPGDRLALAAFHARWREYNGCSVREDWPDRPPPHVRAIWATFEPHNEDCDYMSVVQSRESAKDDPKVTCPLHDEDCPCNEGEECEALPLENFEDDCACGEYGWWLTRRNEGTGYPVTEVWL